MLIGWYIGGFDEFGFINLTIFQKLLARVNDIVDFIILIG